MLSSLDQTSLGASERERERERESASFTDDSTKDFTLPKLQSAVRKMFAALAIDIPRERRKATAKRLWEGC